MFHFVWICIHFMHICFVTLKPDPLTLLLQFFPQKKKKEKKPSKTLQCCVNKLKVHGFGIVICFFFSSPFLFSLHFFYFIHSIHFLVMLYIRRNRTKKNVNLLKQRAKNPKCRALKCLRIKLLFIFMMFCVMSTK